MSIPWVSHKYHLYHLYYLYHLYHLYHLNHLYHLHHPYHLYHLYHLYQLYLGADGLWEVHLEGSHIFLTKYQTFLTKYGIECPFKRNMLTAEGQHFIFPLNMGYIPYYRVILCFRGIFLPEKRVLQDMICCPSPGNKCPFKRTYYSIFGKECLVFGNIICCPFRMKCLAPYTVPLSPNCIICIICIIMSVFSLERVGLVWDMFVLVLRISA